MLNAVHNSCFFGVNANAQSKKRFVPNDYKSNKTVNKINYTLFVLTQKNYPAVVANVCFNIVIILSDDPCDRDIKPAVTHINGNH